MGLILRSIVTCLIVSYALGMDFNFPKKEPCIMVQMNVDFKLSYNNETIGLLDPVVNPNRSECALSGTTATLVLSLGKENDTLTFTFTRDKKKVGMFLMYEFTPLDHFKDSNDSNPIVMVSPKKELSMSNMSYKCDSSQIIGFNKSMYELVMTVAKLQVQAFGVKNGNFSAFEECSEDTVTTTEIPTSSPHPTITPHMQYLYKYPADNACILLDAAIQVDINYTDTKNATATAIQNIPDPSPTFGRVKISGQCINTDAENEYIKLTWNDQFSTFSLKMDFVADMDDIRLKTMEVIANLSSETYPLLHNKSVIVRGKKSMDLFLSSKNSYFFCDSHQEETLDDIKVVIYKIKVQAFGVKNSSFTGDGTECSQDLSTENPTPTTVTTETTTNTTHTSPTTNTTHTSPTTNTTHTTTETTTNTTQTSSTTNTNATTTTSNGTTATTAPISTTAIIPNPTNKYSVGDGNVTCVYFVARMDFTFPYTTNNGTNTSVVISVPQNFEVNGTCSTPNDTTNELNIYFYNYSWRLAFVFGPDNSSSQLGDMQFNTYSVKSISLDYKMDSTLFPGYNDTKMGHAQANITETLFQSKVNGSYKCNADFAVSFSGNIKLETYNLQYKAFNKDNSTNFGGDLSECSADKSNDNKTNSVVPIAVGAALAGLVVIVLIAYLIGRRRNRKGYESV